MFLSILNKILRRKPKRKPPVWEIYNGKIADMRREGATLQEIGNVVGVTRERVRQILNEKYGKIEVLLLPEYKAAEVIGCLVYQLQSLRQQGRLTPTRHTGKYCLYSRDDIEKAMLAIQRNCPHCNEPLPMIHLGKYCSKCKKDYHRNAWPFLSEKTKRKRAEASRSWQRRHPEQYKEIQKRAMGNYTEKKRREYFPKTRYVIVNGIILPTGTIFKAIRCKNSRLILENGLEIPVCHTMKIKEEIQAK